MHEQEFERSVQRKMEELSFTPSVPVWERVEAEIRRRKKRRLAFWLLPVVVTMAIAGFYFFKSLPETITAEQKAVPVLPGATRVQTVPQHINKNAPSAKKETAQSMVAPLPVTGRVFSSMATVIGKKKTRYSSGALFPVTHQHNETGRLASANEIDVAAGTPDLQMRTVPAIPVLTAARSQVLQAVNPEQVTRQLRPAPINITPSAQWQWSLHLQYGRSQLATEGINRPASMDFANSPSPVQNGSPGLLLPAMQVSDGPYVSAQIGLRKKIGARWYLQTGVEYARYTQRVAVGRKVSLANFASTRSFYEPGNFQSYYFNTFQQVGVPLSLQHKPFRKLPLEIEGGIAAGFLFGAKALALDTAIRLFAEQKPELRRLQLPLKAGMQYRLAKSHKWEWLAGAQLQYHLTGINKRHQVPRLYAFSLGVRVRSK